MKATPPIVDRETWNVQLAELRVREKAHTREGDALAAVRRRLPMVEVDPTTPLVGGTGTMSLLDTFEGRSQLFASYHMWHTGLPAAKQCEGCTFNSGQVRELSYLHARDVTYAVFCEGPFDESNRYREFMGWEMPWYSVPEESVERLIAGRHFGMKVCYLREGDRVFETYWTTARGCEVMNGSFGILDMTVYGRQEHWETSPEGWPVIYGPHSNSYRLMEDGSAPPSAREGRPPRSGPALPPVTATTSAAPMRSARPTATETGGSGKSSQMTTNRAFHPKRQIEKRVKQYARLERPAQPRL